MTSRGGRNTIDFFVDLSPRLSRANLIVIENKIKANERKIHGNFLFSNNEVSPTHNDHIV